jgi:hypothetical protein
MRTVLVNGHVKRKRTNEMGRTLQKVGTLTESLKNERKFVIFEVTKPAMHQLRRSRRGPVRKIIFFDEGHFVPARGGIPGYTRSRDSASDNEKIKLLVLETL